MGAPAILLALTALTTLVPATGGRIVAEWSPGIPEAGAGGELVVDTYGVGGLGAYGIAFDDGTTHLAVCVQADIGHSLSAVYVADPTVSLPAELGYLAWAYLAGGAASDVEAAAVNLLAWRYTDAQRSTGGSVWQGHDVEVRVLGVGRLHDVEEAAARLHAEATARLGPWSFADLRIDGSTASVRVVGSGGPIGGVPVRFDDGAGWTAVVDTGTDGGAATVVPAGATVSVRASGPGAAVALVADGSQRLAMAGPPAELATELVVPPTTTTSTTTTSTTPTTTTTTTTTTTSSTTTPPPSFPPAPPTAPPTPPPTTPPTLPPTGSSARDISRIGAALFAAGAVAVLCSAGVRSRRATSAHPRRWSR